MEILSWIGVTLGLFAGLLVVSKRNSSTSDRLLAGWLFLLAIEFFSTGMDYNQFGYPLLSNGFLLMNPAFFLYIRSLVRRSFKIKWLHLLHLLPYLTFEISVYILKEPLNFGDFFTKEGIVFFRVPFGLVSLISWAVYNGLSLLTVVRHRRNAENEFSNFGRGKTMYWILVILIFYSFICLVSFILGVVSVFGEELQNLPHYFVLISLLGLVFLLGFYGQRQGQIYELLEKEVATKDKEYKRPQLKQEQKEKIKALLFHAFEEDKIYLNPELNMDLLSVHIAIPKHHITEVLNTVIGRNFFQFVNQFRVEAVKEMLKDEKNPYAIEAIAYDCGFSSKSSFFTTFKKLTGITPAQFRAK